jgi:hypothetical protein
MNSAAKAIAFALDSGLTHSTIDVSAWAATYGISTEDFKIEWERQQSERSLSPDNSFEVEGK